MKASVKMGKGVEALFGTLDENLRTLERCLKVSTHLSDETLEIVGEEENVRRAERAVEEYNELVARGLRFEASEVQSFLRIMCEDPEATLKGLAEAGRPRTFGKKTISPKSLNQRRYVDAIENHDMVFGIGPSGTGKTYLAVALAVDALLTREVSRIILARPAVEAGERLGFLPGTVQEKVNPYLRPLYDALYDVLDPERVERYLEKGIIEIAPIAFMRGRTLNDAFVILDEAQNTTSEQMKMFLTRLGFNSKAVITGDVTQVDLPSGRRSGLMEAIEVVKNVEGISFIYFTERDVVRHNLVQRIIRAYEEFDLARGGESRNQKSRFDSAQRPEPVEGEIRSQKSGAASQEPDVGG
jgi:phosphate starvation-inducible protein PhoH and related proteins